MGDNRQIDDHKQNVSIPAEMEPFQAEMKKIIQKIRKSIWLIWGVICLTGVIWIINVLLSSEPPDTTRPTTDHDEPEDEIMVSYWLNHSENIMVRVREEILPYLKTGANNISPVQKVGLINLKLLRIGMSIFHTVYQKLLQSVKNQNVHF